MEQLAWDIGETSHALRRAFDRRAAELGITRAQWRVLAHLDHQPGQRQVDLAERMDIEPITLCRIVDKLEEAALVERRRDPGDRRAWQLYLRDSAAPLVLRLHALAEAFSAEVFGNLDPAELERSRALLATIRNNISGMAPRSKASA
ncbi:MarR family winged helix-turn-helix transcriptional regulator [Sphingomonas glaciei]|uniref:MarR family transcriptional regulator n=1 Tax=Sphingomonas glaciei TaxID=2938948 RepID=A0ABY5MVL8_9SPHN|nr:MarR family transcriptional regulator [Sphingomonas glaciei]UUR08495.1 MarR family transcriptional regulator [Sphingomonas glaciei]